MFHALGFMQAIVGIALGSTLVVRRRFDPEATLESLERAQGQRDGRGPGDAPADCVDLGEEEIGDRDLSELRIIFVSGSALGADLAATGDQGVRAGDLQPVRLDRGCLRDDRHTGGSGGGRLPSVGKVVRGSVVKIFDEDDNEVATGESGRIFVGNFSQFEGYTGGGNKEAVQGLMSSGDVGHFDEEGRLFIDGRDDEMIVSGGENVFPAEIEELLAAHDGIKEAAAVGVDDEKFGQRLKAFVVLGDGPS